MIPSAFAKLAAGTSNSGTPKSPIDRSHHPLWSNAAARENLRRLDNADPYFCWDHAYHAALIQYPYFKQQPAYSNVLNLWAARVHKMPQHGARATHSGLPIFTIGTRGEA